MPNYPSGRIRPTSITQAQEQGWNKAEPSEEESLIEYAIARHNWKNCHFITQDLSKHPDRKAFSVILNRKLRQEIKAPAKDTQLAD